MFILGNNGAVHVDEIGGFDIMTEYDYNKSTDRFDVKYYTVTVYLKHGSCVTLYKSYDRDTAKDFLEEMIETLNNM